MANEQPRDTCGQGHWLPCFCVSSRNNLCTKLVTSFFTSASHSTQQPYASCACMKGIHICQVLVCFGSQGLSAEALASQDVCDYNTQVSYNRPLNPSHPFFLFVCLFERYTVRVRESAGSFFKMPITVGTEPHRCWEPVAQLGLPSGHTCVNYVLTPLFCVRRKLESGAGAQAWIQAG